MTTMIWDRKLNILSPEWKVQIWDQQPSVASNSTAVSSTKLFSLGSFRNWCPTARDWWQQISTLQFPIMSARAQHRDDRDGDRKRKYYTQHRDSSRAGDRWCVRVHCFLYLFRPQSRLSCFLASGNYRAGLIGRKLRRRPVELTWIVNVPVETRN